MKQKGSSMFKAKQLLKNYFGLLSVLSMLLTLVLPDIGPTVLMNILAFCESPGRFYSSLLQWDIVQCYQRPSLKRTHQSPIAHYQPLFEEDQNKTKIVCG